MTLSCPQPAQALAQSPMAAMLNGASDAPWWHDIDYATRPAPTTSCDEQELLRLTINYGGPVTGALLDPAYALFRAPGIPGVIGYRRSFRCAIALGDPVCPPASRVELAQAFRTWCRALGLRTAYASASEAFATEAAAMGYGCIEVCQEQVLDPARDPLHGSKGGGASQDDLPRQEGWRDRARAQAGRLGGEPSA